MQAGVGGRPGSAILAGLGHVGPAAAFSMAGLLGFGGPKRLVLTFLAMGDGQRGDDRRRRRRCRSSRVYIGVATVLVWVPVGIVIIAGERAAVILERGQSWLTTHAAVLRVWLALGLGAALIVDGARAALADARGRAAVSAVRGDASGAWPIRSACAARRVVREVLARYGRLGGSQFAAAISYRALFSLVPLATFVATILAQVLSAGERRPAGRRLGDHGPARAHRAGRRSSTG